MENSVIIITLNYNQVNYTIQCVNSLLKSKYANFQIILIDNGSTEENYNSLKDRLPNNSKILLNRIESNIGYVGGVNFALELGIKLNPEYILIMNNDTIIDYEAIYELVEACKRNINKVIVTGKVLYYDNPNVIQTVGNEFRNRKTFETYIVGKGEEDNGQYNKEIERAMIDDIFWLFPRKLVEEIGLYSNWYGFGWEQADWAQRAKAIGYRLIFTPGAKILHKENATVGHKIRTPYKVFWSIQGHLMFKWIYISKSAFIKTYLKTILEIVVAFYYDFIHIFIKKNQRRNGVIKLQAFLRFHLWILLKMNQEKFNPKSIMK